MILEFILRVANRVPARYLRHLANWWSPFRGAGIRITYVSPDVRELRVRMRLRWYNRNHAGVHFGGSLYAMTDPFYTTMLKYNLGDDYVVWDKKACIEFRKPGRDTVQAQFILSEADIETARREADQHGKYEFDKYVEVTDPRGEVIAAAVKTLYVRRRRPPARATGE